MPIRGMIIQHFQEFDADDKVEGKFQKIGEFSGFGDQIRYFPQERNKADQESGQYNDRNQDLYHGGDPFDIAVHNLHLFL